MRLDFEVQERYEWHYALLFKCSRGVYVRASRVQTRGRIVNSKTGVVHSSSCVMLPQETIFRCSLFVTQFSWWNMSAFQHASVSPLMRDSPRRVQCLSAPLSVEVIELNFPRISRLRLPSALLCCGERLSDYRTIRKDVKKKWTVLKVRDSSYAQRGAGLSVQLCVWLCLSLSLADGGWENSFAIRAAGRCRACKFDSLQAPNPPPPTVIIQVKKHP